jgi:hypothetical protein
MSNLIWKNKNFTKVENRKSWSKPKEKVSENIHSMKNIRTLSLIQQNKILPFP